MIQSALRSLGGWGNYPIQNGYIFRPENRRDVIEAFNSVGKHSIISRGLGRSYGDASLNQDGQVLLHTRVSKFLDFDAETGILSCESGTSFYEIIDAFLPRGYFLPVTPGTKYVTLGGAIAADVHGKNHHCDGSLASYVIDFELLTANGEIVRCSRDNNTDIFWATVGGMGLTGSILSARIQLLPVPSAYIQVDYRRTKDLDHTLEQFEQTNKEYRYSVAWIDCLSNGRSLGRSVLSLGDHAALTRLGAKENTAPYAVNKKNSYDIPFFAPNFLLNSATTRLFNSLYYRWHPDSKNMLCDYDTFFYPLDSVAHWNRIYGRRGFIQYQAVIGTERSRQALIEILECLSKSGSASFLAVLKSFGASSGGLLSFPQPGHTLALDIPNTGGSMRRTVRALDAIVIKYGGRVYLAKDACLDAETFAAMYPQADRFKTVKQKLDPHGVVSSSLARRVGLI